jgi:hypothetical protein
MTCVPNPKPGFVIVTPGTRSLYTDDELLLSACQDCGQMLVVAKETT